MKKKNTLSLYILISIGFVLILTNSCKKDDDNNVNPEPPTTVVDIDGNVYNTVTIGTQVWIVENLKTTHYNNGTAIPLVTNDTTWSELTTSGYCWYNNDDTTYSNPYGALYNWHTVNTGNLCPTGWHVPADAEWTYLTNYLGGESVAGGKLKTTGTMNWNPPNTGATNESGFSALPGGFRAYDGSFYEMGDGAYFWSSTESGSDNAWYQLLYYYYEDLTHDNQIKNHGFSIRCLMD